MKNTKGNEQGELFSDDPVENLRIENEILHLKLKAELGGDLVGDLPLSPELENTFIKSILEFEHAFEHSHSVEIFDLLGKPEFPDADLLDDDQVDASLNDLFSLLSAKNMELDFAGEYTARLKYTFITRELFHHEADDIQIPGYVTHFIYEEFHPNHKLDIEARAIEFIEGWCNRQLDEDSWELGDTFILEDGRQLSRLEVITKIRCVFDSYQHFNNSVYSFVDSSFQFQENTEKAWGFAEGFISYDAVLESGETLRVEGPFKIYLSLHQQWWNIIYFVMPGFIWD